MFLISGYRRFEFNSIINSVILGRKIFMRLYLTQHGRAKSKDEDPERPLTEIGWAETKKIALLLYANKNFRLNEIYHSGKTRSKQTAEMIGQHLEIPNKVNEIDSLNPMDDPTIWFNRIQDMNDDTMIVGHLPHLEKLTLQLLKDTENESIIKFQNSCVLCLERNNVSNWVIKWLIVPEALP